MAILLALFDVSFLCEYVTVDVAQYYVPLLRSDDNSCPAKVAQPICLRELSLSKWNGILHPNASDGRLSADPGCAVGSPKDSPLSVRACAGPMSRSEVTSNICNYISVMPTADFNIRFGGRERERDSFYLKSDFQCVIAVLHHDRFYLKWQSICNC